MAGWLVGGSTINKRNLQSTHVLEILQCIKTEEFALAIEGERARMISKIDGKEITNI